VDGVAGRPGNAAEARPVGRAAARSLRRGGGRGRAVPATHLPGRRGEGDRRAGAGPAGGRPGGPAVRPCPGGRRHPGRRRGGLLRLALEDAGRARRWCARWRSRPPASACATSRPTC
jgi:hypothetical protein